MSWLGSSHSLELRVLVYILSLYIPLVFHRGIFLKLFWCIFIDIYIQICILYSRGQQISTLNKQKNNYGTINSTYGHPSNCTISFPTCRYETVGTASGFQGGSSCYGRLRRRINSDAQSELRYSRWSDPSQTCKLPSSWGDSNRGGRQRTGWIRPAFPRPNLGTVYFGCVCLLKLKLRKVT